ncbi:hypothetical protein ACFL7D_07585 [candidate division KSB1 bacterium]
MPREIPSYLTGMREYASETAKSFGSTLKYFPPLKYLRTDGQYVFGFHYNISAEEKHRRTVSDKEMGEKMEIDSYMVDIVDVAAGKLIARAQFPFFPDVIRNEYAYRMYTPPGEFPVIEKYRIDPSVYGK